MLSATLVSVKDDLVMSTFGDNYVCSVWDWEQTLSKYISKHFIAFRFCEHAALHTQTCCTKFLSLPNRNGEVSFWSLGVPVGLQGSKALSQGSSWSSCPCPWDFLLQNRLKLCTVRQGLWSMQEPRSSVTHHFTGQLHKVMGNCQAPMGPGHEWDPSWKQPVVSPSGRCAQGTWTASRNQVQTCLLVGLKEAEGKNWEFDVITETWALDLADWQDQNNAAKWIQILQAVKQSFSKSLLWIWIDWIPLLVPCVHPECIICVPTKI